jgi:hypothetical protein
MLENPSRNTVCSGIRDGGWRDGLWVWLPKEVVKNRLQDTATVRRFLDGTNVANQRPPSLWSGLKSTNPAISSQLRAVFCWLSRLSGLKFETRNGGVCFLLHSTDCTLLMGSREGLGARS